MNRRHLCAFCSVVALVVACGSSTKDRTFDDADPSANGSGGNGNGTSVLGSDPADGGAARDCAPDSLDQRGCACPKPAARAAWNGPCISRPWEESMRTRAAVVTGLMLSLGLGGAAFAQRGYYGQSVARRYGGANQWQAEQMVRQAYRDILGREPDPSGMQEYVVKAFLMESAENRRFSEVTRRLFRTNMLQKMTHALSSPLMEILGVLVVAMLLAYEHSLVRADDLSKLNAAFFTMNGVIAVVFFVFVAADLLVKV